MLIFGFCGLFSELITLKTDLPTFSQEYKIPRIRKCLGKIISN